MSSLVGTITALLTLGLGVAAILLFSWFLHAWRSGKRKERHASLTHTATRLGLQVQGDTLRGTFGGIGISLAVRRVEAIKYRDLWTVASAQIAPPLFLGLSIRSRFNTVQLHALKRALRGAEDLEKAFKLDALYRRDALRLVSEPSLSDALLKTAREFRELSVTDDRIELKATGDWSDPASAEHLLRWLTGLVRCFVQAKLESGPFESDGGLRSAWSLLASEEGDRFDAQHNELTGEIGAHRYRVTPVVAKSARTRFELRFGSTVGATFRLMHPRGPSAGLRTGDVTFDQMFRVEGVRPEILAVFSDVELRRALVGLAQNAARVELTPGGLIAEAPGLLTEKQAVRTSLTQVARIADALTGLGPSTSVGAYR